MRCSHRSILLPDLRQRTVQYGMGKQDDNRVPRTNREKKVEGRSKRRRFVQGTRAYTHALTNSIAKRAGVKGTKRPK